MPGDLLEDRQGLLTEWLARQAAAAIWKRQGMLLVPAMVKPCRTDGLQAEALRGRAVRALLTVVLATL